MMGISFASDIAITLLITLIICLILRSFKKFEYNAETILKIFFCILYMFLVYCILIKPYIYDGTGRVPEDVSVLNLALKPFDTISTYSADKNYIPILGSIFITMPLFPLAYWNLRRHVSNKKCFFIFLIFVCMIEPIQLVVNIITSYPNKVIDIDDFILNLIGYLIGYVLTTIIYRIVLRISQKIDIKTEFDN